MVEFRKADLSARLGGDELCALLLGTYHADEAIARLRARLDDDRGRGAPSCGISIGTAVFDPTHPVPLEDLIAAGDAAMYEEKRTRPDRR